MRVLAALAAVLLASPVWAATTRTTTIYLPAAGCRDTTPGAFFSLQTTTPPGVECISEREGVLAYADAANEGAVTSFRLPATWVSASGINASIAWRTNTDTGAVGWCVQLICTADNESINPGFPALGAGNCVSDTAAAGPDNVNFAAITGVTATGCAAGEIAWVRVSRDGAGTVVTDSVTQDADLISLELTMVDTGVTLESAATGVLGGVQLDDDLGGTAASPDVVDVTCSGSCISDAEVDAAITVDWTGLQTYPTACSAGNYVQGVGDTLTCAADDDAPESGDFGALTGGAGITNTAGTLATDSTEQNFLASGALTCGANTNGKAQVHTTPLQYCDNAATPTLRYAAYADSSGNATSGDSATSFFSTGTVEADRLPKGDDDAATLGVVTLADEEFDCTTGSCVLAAASIDGGTAGEIADASITAADLATDSVAADEIATSGVATAEILDATVAQADIDDTYTLAGNPAMAANEVWFGTTGLIFEGATGGADNIETLLTVADPTSADKTLTLPNESGTVLTSATTATKSVYWPAESLNVDGTHCLQVAPALLATGGPVGGYVTCADNDAGYIYGRFTTPDSWDLAETIVLRVISYTTDATTSGADTLAFDVSCMYRGVGEIIDNNWSASPLAMDTVYPNGTAYYVRHGDTTAVTCNGTTPTAGDSIFWRAKVDATTTTVNPSTDSRILGVRLEYGIKAYTD